MFDFNHNVQVLSEHFQDSLYANENGKIDWVDKSQIIKRITNWIYDPSKAKLEAAIHKTLQTMINQAKRNKEIEKIGVNEETSNLENCVLYSNLMVDLFNKRVIGYNYYKEVLQLKHATSRLTDEPLLEIT